jgi:hypothetical protein
MPWGLFRFLVGGGRRQPILHLVNFFESTNTSYESNASASSGAKKG